MTASVRTRAPAVGLVSLLFSTIVVLKFLIPNHGDPSIFLALGERATIQTEYARGLLGEVIPRTRGGHDGKYFFAQANDPWYIDPQTHAVVLDRPIYRGQRMLYPMLAGGFGLFPPHVVVWTMLVTNLLALGFGAFLAARLSMLWGASPWLGLAIPLNPGLIYEVWIGGSGIVAYVFCLGAVYAIVREREWGAALLLAGAALSREVMLALAIGLFVLGWLERHRRWRLVAVPAVAMVIWNLYLQFRLAGVSGVGGGPQIFALPFTGLWQALELWLRRPDDLLFNGAMLAVIVTFTIRAYQSRLPLAWGALPFVFLAMTLSVHVWTEPFDLSRALVPVFTAAPFLLLVHERESAPLGTAGPHGSGEA